MLRKLTNEDIKKVEPPCDWAMSQGLVTRSGAPARVISVLKNVPAPLVVWVHGRMENYFLDGRHNQVYPSHLDLFVKEL